MTKLLVLSLFCFTLNHSVQADEMATIERSPDSYTTTEEGKVIAEGYEEEIKREADKPKKTTTPDPKPILPPAGKYPSSLLSLGDGGYFSKYAFVADKGTRTLTVWQNNSGNIELVAAHAMDMGRKDGDKMILGDLKTPEGIYFFQETFSRRQLDFNEYGQRAFTMDYPNFFDRLERKTGSGIWLHAIPETKTLKRGSRGCLVVRNNVIEGLKKYVDLKMTPIVVEPKVTYVKPRKKKQNYSEFKTWLNSWRKDWQSKNVDSYISHYGSDFSALKMNRDQWKEYKTGLNAKYEFINVKLIDPIIFAYNDEYIVQFLQKYESDLLQDFGEKTLHIKKIDGKFQILSESWKPVNKQVVAKYKTKD